ncbi:MAG TPA: HD domain-containing protein [Pyrinomonadaceae bacterium]|jgi:HD superfamily phosphohydrolase|nr:HD domain-containing protein [Pyrinomonadaceae bacterium]
MSERIYRDPVHNIIRLRTDTDEGELMMRLIDTPEFQRLRRIKQLGLGLYTYQGAEHSRFTHSLGAFHLMSRVLDRLGEKYQINQHDRTAARAAALLHDVGHGSFSHVMEKVLGLHHERWTVEVVLSDVTRIGQLLRAYSPELPAKVAAIIEGKFQPAALGQLVSSQLDVDRMDYLLRDSLMTGAKYGIYDLEWIINALAIDEEHDRIYVAARGLYAVEEYLQARYYMFRQVYFHRTLRSAEAVLQAILRRALRLLETGESVWHAPDTAFEQVLRRNSLELTEYLEVDDSDVLFHVKQWQRSSDAILADLSKRFTGRRLFKAIDLDMPIAERAEFLSKARECVRRAGYDPDYYFIEDRASDVPYYNYYTAEGAEPKSRIYVEDGYANPRIREITEVSEVVRGLQRGYELHRVCFPSEVKSEVYELYHKRSSTDHLAAGSQ